MNNINIKNIFTNSSMQMQIDNNNYEYDNKSNASNKSKNKKCILINDFSVGTLINSNSFKTTISDDFIVNKIKFNKLNDKKKINELYETNYRECLIKINSAIEINLTDIIYSVSLSYFGYEKYIPFDCVKYIEKKLKEKKFLTLILSSKDIFISWANITND